MIEATAEKERARSRFALLSTVGAGLAGVGIGILLGRSLADLAWFIAAIGVLVHLTGMVGVRRVMATAGYVPARWENVSYFVCWLLIIAGFAITVLRIAS